MTGRKEDASLTLLVEEEKRTRLRPTCGYCKDCKHWKQAVDVFQGEFRPAPVGICKMTSRDNPLFWTAMARIPMIPICTRPNFGCVQFEAKA